MAVPSSSHSRNGALPPPIVPFPPNFYVQDPNGYQSPPHFADPLVAPKPQKLNSDVPANMARALDDQVGSWHRSSPPQPPSINYNPGFAVPGGPWNTTSPPPNIRNNGPPLMPVPAPHTDSLSPSIAALSFSSKSPQPHTRHNPRTSSMYASYGPSRSPAPLGPAPIPSLTAPLPTVAALTAALPSIQQPHGDPAVRIAWCRDVLFLVERSQQNGSNDPPVGPIQISDPQLQSLVQVAVPIVLQIAAPQPMPSPMPVSTAEAIYLRATFSASGAYPEHVRHNPRAAFRDFEQAARGGYAAAWFRLGRDYENFNDAPHARDCFERGVKLKVESCTYRMGMAHLMGQLDLPPSPEQAIPLLQRAATLASLDVPQPAYVYGLLLLAEFSHVVIPPQLLASYIPAGSTIQAEARKHLERAAYLNFAPAQYKLGHAYEFAQPPFPFDALLSVQYYSLASQQGEIEADMALSKWFLCGAEGSFDKDESLAYTFAEKAARKGLPSAEFAMGYYAEVGVGGLKDLETARKWYTRAADHGNTDAVERLGALSQPSPQALSRQEHDNITESKLVRKRTLAKQRSESISIPNGGPPPGGDGCQILDDIRRTSLAERPVDYPASQYPAPQQQYPSQRPAPIPEYPEPSGRRVSGGPPPGAAPPHDPRNTSPRMHPAAAPPRQFPDQQRYTLTDGGPTNAPASGRTQSPQGRAPFTRLPSSGAPLPSPGPQSNGAGAPPAPRPAPSKGPTTFAEMGIQGAKLEEKECVIM